MNYLGLKIAWLLSPTHKIACYWSLQAFVGSRDISTITGQDKFKMARSNLKHYPEYNNEVASKDLLWHLCAIMLHFQRNCIPNVVQTGVTAFDKNGIRSRGRCAAISYIKMKSDQYVIQLYASVR